MGLCSSSSALSLVFPPRAIADDPCSEAAMSESTSMEDLECLGVVAPPPLMVMGMGGVCRGGLGGDFKKERERREPRV